MDSDLEGLRISDIQIKQISGASIQDSFLSEYYRVWAKLNQKESDSSRRSATLLQFLVLEFALFFVTLVLTFPVALLMTKNSWGSSPLEADYSALFSLVGALSGLGWFTINLYLYFKSKAFANLLNLLNQLEKYDKVVDIFYRMDKLIQEGYIEDDDINRNQMVQALKITKESFIHSFKSERLVREYHQVNLPDELFQKLDSNLSDLIDFDVQGQDGHYGRLINETLEIGISVHRELRKLQHIHDLNG